MRSKALAKRLKNPEPITTPSRDHHSLISRNPGRRTGSTSVRAYVYDFTKEERNLSLLKNGKLHKGIINDGGAKLSDEQIERLQAALRSKEERIPGAFCYMPHHGFVFFDADGKPMGHIELCFQCGNVDSSPEGLPDNEWNWKEISKILGELKIPILEKDEDYTKLYEAKDKKIENKSEMATPRKPSD